jgi:ribose-phosphate pyrophosphokinase
MMSNFYVLANSNIKEVNFIEFSDGCEICKVEVEGIDPDARVRVVAAIENGNRDVVRLGLVKNALDNLGCRDVALTMNYVPNARADRIFTKGQSFSLKVTCDIINSFGYTSVVISDPHSDVAPALLDNVDIRGQDYLFECNMHHIEEKVFTLVAPDIGAAKKTFDIAKRIGHEDFIQAVKIRDVSTGQIVKCDVQCDSLVGQTVVMADDIADGGASFIYLARKLREKGAKKIILYVTHGIFSKGLAPLVGEIDQIICDNLIERYINKRDIELFNYK